MGSASLGKKSIDAVVVSFNSRALIPFTVEAVVPCVELGIDWCNEARVVFFVSGAYTRLAVISDKGALVDEVKNHVSLRDLYFLSLPPVVAALERALDDRVARLERLKKRYEDILNAVSLSRLIEG